MRTDHWRPLLAYVLVTLVCAFVVAPSLDLGGLGLGSKPTFSTLSDPMMTPSELAGQVEESTRFDELPYAAPVDPPAAEGEDTFVPDVDVIRDAVDELPWVMGDGETSGAAGSTTQGPADGGVSLPVGDPPQTDLIVSGGPSGGPSGDGNGSSGDGDGAAGGPTDPDVSGGSGIFDGIPPSGGPLTSPGDGGVPTGGADGDDGQAAPGNGNSNSNSNSNGNDNDNDNGHHNGNPLPHSFDYVPPGAHPNGQVGPPKDKGDKGPKGDKGHGPKDKAPKAKSDKGHGPKDKAPKDKAPKAKAPKDKSDKGHGPKDKAPKDKAPKGHGKR